MGRKVGYLFAKESDLDRTKRSNNIVLGIDTTAAQTPLIRGKITAFVKVLSLVAMTEDKKAKCVDVVPDSTTGDYAVPLGTPWQFDSDNLTNDYTTTNVLSMTALAVDEVVEVEQYIDKSTDFQWLAKKQGGGSSLIWLTTDNTGLSFADGARYDRPGGTGSALTVDDTYYISTPWNTRIVPPINNFGYFVQAGKDWYKTITQFSVKPSANYPSGAGAGITAFTCYLERSDSSLNLGTNTAFPSGIKIILDGFDNENAALNSLNFFNGKVFDARFDTAANIIYLDKASF